jgi:hypothetical protein
MRVGVKTICSSKSTSFVPLGPNSPYYSPVLGPALRRALSKYNVDVVLDGEILSWDNGRQETIPFGQNRTVALLRQKWMKLSGQIDERDVGLHVHDVDEKVMQTSNISNVGGVTDSDLAGEECWLQYCAFDVLYIGGPDAARLLLDTVSPHIQPCPEPGPIIDLDGLERKKLLYKLINTQEREVEVVATWVVRPTGQTVVGSEYFSPELPTMECGYRASDLDSLSWTLKQTSSAIQELDSERRQGLSDDQISLYRAMAADRLYGIMVDDQRMEGLLFKDLCAPYYLGADSKTLAYWLKFKPDYYNGSVASDLDVVIIGAYFASGMRQAGRPSAFLCGCVDSEDSERFFTLCKVNAGSMKYSVLDELFASTGLGKDEDTGRVEIGDKWFMESDRKTIPEFVTSRTFQPGQDGGWRPKKIDYPDMWINPTDSRVLTLNAGEIVASDVYSAGLALRFPRVTALRGKSEKKASHVENELTLWQIYRKHIDSRSVVQSSQVLQPGSPLASEASSHRFLTEDQYFGSHKQKRKSTVQKKLFKVATLDDVGTLESNTLKNMVFTVLDGTYKLDENFIDLDEAAELGWLEAARSVASCTGVKFFIKQHGGTLKLAPDGDEYVIGGNEKDPRVLSHVQAITSMRARVAQRKGKASTTQRALQEDKIARGKGVLHWTFPFALVFRRLKGKTGEHDVPRATVFDYLARPSEDGSDPLLTDLCSEEFLSTRNLQRALDLVGKSTHKPVDHLSWQSRALTQLAPDERWVAGSHYQTLWIHREGLSQDNTRVVLYPDIYDDAVKGYPVRRDIMSSKLQSVLPLVRIMGGDVASQLHEGVTHVLCDLRVDDEVLVSVELIKHPDVFTEPERGRHLIKQLRSGNSVGILLVSPNWIRKRKWNHN